MAIRVSAERLKTLIAGAGYGEGEPVIVGVHGHGFPGFAAQGVTAAGDPQARTRSRMPRRCQSRSPLAARRCWCAGAGRAADRTTAAVLSALAQVPALAGRPGRLERQ